MLTKINFPVLAFSKPALVELIATVEELTTCNKVALKKGYFSNLELIDSQGMKYIISGAKKVGTVGPMWGYNIFLNQTIKVELTFIPVAVSLQECKRNVLYSFTHWPGWSSREDFAELQAKVHNAASITEIIACLKEE